MSLDLVIRGGTVIVEGDVYQADVGIKGETIAEIGTGLAGARNIDARGKLVLPGAVDPHVHLEMPVGSTTSSDTWESGTIAAACGGTTTVIDFVEPESNQALLEALHARRSLAEGQAAIDFGLHMTLSNADDHTLDQVAEVIAAGCPSFKTYLIYEGFYLDDAAFIKILETVRQQGGIVLVHAENHAMVEYLRRQFLADGKTESRYHALSHPSLAESEAIRRALALAELTHAQLYVVHVSTAAGTEAILDARRRGLPISGETCPQYLLLTEAEYQRPGFEGAKFVCSPPLRTEQDVERLWQGLAQGCLEVVATDHCPFFFDGQKDLGKESFDAIPGGLPGIEARLALLYSFGVRQERISLGQWVETCCTAPARLFRLYPKKGTLAPGADADIVVFDPDLEVRLSHSMLHEQVDYTPYEDLSLCGYPIMTFSRGTILWFEGAYVGSRGHGRFVAR
jgi:dihydropyrimidinase